jgi:hypothetical protein
MFRRFLPLLLFLIALSCVRRTHSWSITPDSCAVETQLPRRRKWRKRRWKRGSGDGSGSSDGTGSGDRQWRRRRGRSYLKNSGKLEVAQHIANHESPRTRSFTTGGRMKFHSTKSSGSRSEAFRQSGQMTILHRTPLFPAFIGKTGEHREGRWCGTTRGDDQATAETSGACRPTISLTHSGRGITTFCKMTAPWKPRSKSPGMPTAEPQNSMTAATRRCSWRTWSRY